MQNLRMARHQNMFRFFFLELGFGWSLAGIDKMKNWKDKSNLETGVGCLIVLCYLPVNSE